MSKPLNNYYPSEVEISVLKNKIYLLQYNQHGRSHKKILTKAMCIRFSNDPNVASQIRDVDINAFEEGVIS